MGSGEGMPGNHSECTKVICNWKTKILCIMLENIEFSMLAKQILSINLTLVKDKVRFNCVGK